MVPLWNQVRVKEGTDPRISRIIKNTLSKTVLVKNYQVGLEIAKTFNLTCITPDLQIVYAGAFITKFG